MFHVEKMALSETFLNQSRFMINQLIQITIKSKPDYNLVKKLYNTDVPVEFSYGLTIGIIGTSLEYFFKSSLGREVNSDERLEINKLISTFSQELKDYFYKADFR